MAKTRMKTLVIDRRRWLRGEGGGDSALYRTRDGKMCCVGFYCRMVKRLPIAVIRDSRWTYDGILPDDHWLNTDDSPDTIDAERLATVNDARGLDDPSRERQIAAIFAKHGVRAKFAGRGRLLDELTRSVEQAEQNALADRDQGDEDDAVKELSEREVRVQEPANTIDDCIEIFRKAHQEQARR